MLFVSTPGSFANTGPDDWVHAELKWWIENQRPAPIIIDATGLGAKWLPTSVTKKWPDSQRVLLNLGEDRDTILKPIIDGILLSGTTVLFEDVSQQRRVLLKYRRAFIAALCAVLLSTLVTAFTLILNARITASYNRLSELQGLLDRSVDANIDTLDANIRVLTALVGEGIGTASPDDSTATYQLIFERIARLEADDREVLHRLAYEMKATQQRLNAFDSYREAAGAHLPQLELLRDRLRDEKDSR